MVSADEPILEDVSRVLLTEEQLEAEQTLRPEQQANFGEAAPRRQMHCNHRLSFNTTGFVLRTTAVRQQLTLIDRSAFTQRHCKNCSVLDVHCKGWMACNSWHVLTVWILAGELFVSSPGTSQPTEQHEEQWLPAMVRHQTHIATCRVMYDATC